MSNTNIYLSYTYGYLRSVDSKTAKAGTFYYIGKGVKNRAYNCHGKTPVPKDKSNIIFLAVGISDDEACALEIAFIECFGRKDIGTGILLNLTDGGQGTNGCKHTEEQNNSKSIRSTGKAVSEDRKQATRKTMLGTKHTDIRRLNQSIAAKNRAPASEETKSRRKITAARNRATKRAQIQPLTFIITFLYMLELSIIKQNNKVKAKRVCRPQSATHIANRISSRLANKSIK